MLFEILKELFKITIYVDKICFFFKTVITILNKNNKTVLLCT